MDERQGKRILEGLLFVVGQPLALKRLTQILPDLEVAKIRQLIHTLNDEYAASGRAFLIQEVAGGYQIVTDQELAPWIQRALQSPRPDSVSTATMETLAIIAYRQPITKADIEAIRGVDVTASLETLLERRFARMAGRKETPGRPFLYATTGEFLRHFGLKSIEALPHVELPSLKEPGTERPNDGSGLAAVEAASPAPVSSMEQPVGERPARG